MTDRIYMQKAFRLEDGSVIAFYKDVLSIAGRVSFDLDGKFHHGSVIGTFDCPPDIHENYGDGKYCHLVSVTPNLAEDTHNCQQESKVDFPLPLMSNYGMCVHIYASQIESYGHINEEKEHEGLACSFVITRSGREYIVADYFETIMYYLEAYGQGMSLSEAMRYVAKRRMEDEEKEMERKQPTYDAEKGKSNV